MKSVMSYRFWNQNKKFLAQIYFLFRVKDIGRNVEKNKKKLVLLHGCSVQ
jgi:hypothetical protein